MVVRGLGEVVIQRSGYDHCKQVKAMACCVYIIFDKSEVTLGRLGHLVGPHVGLPFDVEPLFLMLFACFSL